MYFHTKENITDTLNLVKKAKEKWESENQNQKQRQIQKINTEMFGCHAMVNVLSSVVNTSRKRTKYLSYAIQFFFRQRRNALKKTGRMRGNATALEHT